MKIESFFFLLLLLVKLSCGFPCKRINVIHHYRPDALILIDDFAVRRLQRVAL
jgi:hypothetical protein